ncbi:phospholipase C [Collimonas pratensis]|uniref:Phosphoesterase family protein n=1 Tax=Collimonas pratensis TaxID=279113 RepID=A0ABM5Z3K0_9BURK|nr:alkaline phosphatase family protein [Collimonas pratensis]AMP13645.1 phosphoesterase family protein [Collimonas pratensis]
MKLHTTFAEHRFAKPALALAITAGLLGGCNSGSSSSSLDNGPTPPVVAKAATPIQHVVVIFQENVSFDHYFGTYPNAANPTGEPAFTAAAGTPVVNNLQTPLDVTKSFAALRVPSLLTANPTTLNTGNGVNAINPFRLDRSQVVIADQDHDYQAEQMGFNGGAMDLFPASLGAGNSAAPQVLTPPLNTNGLTMGYFDGNTVTALWNYAQNYALNDNSFGTTFGPSAPGAINLISGQTNGVIATNLSASQAGNYAAGDGYYGELSSDGVGGINLAGDAQPLNDACMTRDAAQLSGKNVGDMLNAANVSWGFFQGGFDLTVTNANGTTGCKRSTTSAVTGVTKADYIPHHQPFQYYASTANLKHARPSAVAAIGNTFQADGKTVDPANHQYDIHDFFDAVSAGNYPAVSFLKAAGYQDGHAGYSDPLDEQAFVTQVVNFLQKQPGWSNTLVVIAYDDSDGFYDHQASPILNPSNNTTAAAAFTSNGLTAPGVADMLNGPGVCKTNGPGSAQGTPTALSGATGKTSAQGRCGYGPRLPLLVISPYAKTNYVDHTLTDQTSILRFIEDNWLSGQRIAGSYDAIAGTLTNMLNLSGTPSTAKLILDPTTGQPAAGTTSKKL